MGGSLMRAAMVAAVAPATTEVVGTARGQTCEAYGVTWRCGEMAGACAVRAGCA